MKTAIPERSHEFEFFESGELQMSGGSSGEVARRG